MNWLPFICLLIAIGVLTVLYKGTVGHLHTMVHALVEAIGIHEQRIDLHAEALITITENMEAIAEELKLEVRQD